MDELVMIPTIEVPKWRIMEDNGGIYPKKQTLMSLDVSFHIGSSCFSTECLRLTRPLTRRALGRFGFVDGLGFVEGDHQDRNGHRFWMISLWQHDPWFCYRGLSSSRHQSSAQKHEKAAKLCVHIQFERSFSKASFVRWIMHESLGKTLSTIQT